MIRVFLTLRGGKVVDQFQGTDHDLKPGQLEVTGRSDGPDYMGRTYNAGTDAFSPRIVYPETPRRQLINNRNWNAADRDNAIRELLKR